MASISAALREFLKGWSLILPRSCRNCSRLGYDLCPQCLKMIPGFTDPYCPQCHLELGEEGPCPFCRNSPLRWILPLGSYRPPFSDWIQELKFSGATYLIEPFAECLAEKLLELELIPEHWVFVPAPPGNRENFMRGENLPNLLCGVLSRKTGIRTLPLLTKNSPSPPQRTLPRADRLRLSAEDFSLVYPLPKGIYGVILVDDLCTTGATLKALARCILDSYPGALVSAVVLARAQGT